jgi:hypothetical protein
VRTFRQFQAETFEEVEQPFEVAIRRDGEKMATRR